ncbi:unnamed protein product [Orchesella dallaii]|uniref:Gustatory receptor n=1 Tax=Orchesella dallaii TaxID=48710 RepID=A0ABP1S6H2_9HEXA
MSTFPKGAELWLTTFLNFSYNTYTIPIRLKLDAHRNKYGLKTSVSRKIICQIRVFFIAARLLINFLFHRTIFFPTDKGPLGVLYAGFRLSHAILALYYLASMTSSSTHDGLVQLVTLIKDDKTGFLLTKKKRLCVIVVVVFFSVVNIIIPMCIRTQSNFRFGIKKQLQFIWYSFFELNDKKANQLMYSALADYSHEDFPWWKGAVSFLVVLSEVDQEAVIAGSSLVLFVMMAITVESMCSHFARSICDVQKFYWVSNDEITMKFWKIRRIFTIFSFSFGLVLLMNVMFNGIRTCVTIIWVFRSPKPSLTNISMLGNIAAFIYFLCVAAKASNKLLKVSRFLNTMDFRHQRKNGSCKSLGKLIAVHEINSGSVGLCSSGFFIVTYGFIAGMMVTLMSNSAIVLQYYELMVPSNVPVNSTTKETGGGT